MRRQMDGQSPMCVLEQGSVSGTDSGFWLWNKGSVCGADSFVAVILADCQDRRELQSGRCACAEQRLEQGGAVVGTALLLEIAI